MNERRGPIATALAAAGAWLIEPAEPTRRLTAPAPAAIRPIVAVFGLTSGCGVTVVARALAAELASRDPAGAAAVHCDSSTAAIPLATQPATRLARALEDVAGAQTRAVGRLCLVGGADSAALAEATRGCAPLVLDAGSTALGGAPAAIADEVVIVAAPSSEPALAAVASDCLERLGHEPTVVLNRCRAGRDDAGGWPTQTLHRLPDARMGAQLALGGREPRGELGRAVGELADRCEGRG